MRVKATDPSGDSDTATVIINITPMNEEPVWVATSAEEVYLENGTDDVFVYDAEDPEGSGITYSLIDDATNITGVEAADIADVDLFKIHSLDGNLSFKESPNFEDPQDADEGDADAGDNVYHVAVRAESEDDKDPRDAIYQTVTITVINVHERPMFSETTDDLEISENPDDPEKQPPLAAKELYLLNRGAGIPSPANPPEAPNLDVGIPVVAVDDDNTFTATDYTGSTFSRGTYGETTRPVQLIDGLTYTLSGEVEPFDIVPATGQILTTKKLDYEIKNEYKVTVKATDPWGLYGMIDLTIEVTDVDEEPVPRTLAITGVSSLTHEENSTDDLGDYTVTAYGGEVANPRWTLEGSDASLFSLTDSGDTRTLKFRSAPDYEAMADADGDNTYEVTLKVADPSDDAIFNTVGVTVDVTDVNELGALGGSDTASINEGETVALGTYTLTGGTMDATATWTLGGVDMDQFTLDSSQALNFSSAPDYENPMGGADNDSNTYMVTVMASAGGEMEMVEVTVTVDNAMEYGTVTLEPTRPSVGTAIMATLEDPDMVMEDTVMWQWASADAMDGDFTNIDDATMYTYTPVADDAGMYLKAMASYTDGYGDDSAEMVTETAVAQLAVNGEPAVEISEGERNVGTYMASGADNVAWSLTGDDAGDFSINGGQLTFGTAPDFENPADADMDNVYMVTVVATATVGTLMASQPVMVTVTDMDEGGMVTVMPMSAMVGTVLTATLDDPDGGQTAPTWQWSRSGTDIADATSAILHGRRQRRRHVPDGHGHLRRRPRRGQDGLQRGRHGHGSRRAATGSPRL